MIERKFVSQNLKEHSIKEFILQNLSRVGLSEVKLQRTPLGEKIIVSASRPGLVVGRAGANIHKLTKDLKEQFKLENPQIEIEEIKELWLDPNIIAEYIAGSLERFGTKQFKGLGHRSMANIMAAGALGVEILICGKIPSTRAKTWRFYQGYLKKCGDIAMTGVLIAHKTAHLKSGAVGIKVSIMPQDIVLPDKIDILTEPLTIVEEISSKETPEQEQQPAKKTTKKTAKKVAKKTTKKTAKKADEKDESQSEETSQSAERSLNAERSGRFGNAERSSQTDPQKQSAERSSQTDNSVQNPSESRAPTTEKPTEQVDEK